MSSVRTQHYYGYSQATLRRKAAKRGISVEQYMNYLAQKRAGQVTSRAQAAKASKVQTDNG
jgi:hypothetical protein